MHRSALEITKHPAHDLIDPEWVGRTDDQLLDLPMSWINLEIKDSFLEGPMAELNGERETRRCHHRPGVGGHDPTVSPIGPACVGGRGAG
jgi:hypothetical protein